jgi:hypothetical protein
VLLESFRVSPSNVLGWQPIDPREPLRHPFRVSDEIGGEDEHELRDEGNDLERDGVHVDRKIGSEKRGSALVGVGEGRSDVEDIHESRTVLKTN